MEAILALFPGVVKTLGTVFAVFAVVLVGAYVWLEKRKHYWPERGFRIPSGQKLLAGHVEGVNTKRHASSVTQELYRDLKGQNCKIGGFNMFIIPFVMLIDPALIHTVLVKDFSVFHDRGLLADPDVDPLSGTLFALQGKAWRTLRQKMSPTFTSGKMKHMFGTILGVAERLRMHVAEGRMEMKDILARFTTDVIGTCAFGIECNTLENPDSEFLKHGYKVFEQDLAKMIKVIFCLVAPRLSKRFGVKITDRGVEKFFMNLVRETVEYREKHNVQRNDFLNLLIQLKNKGTLSEQDDPGVVGDGSAAITMNELAAQVFIFFLAGFETSSTTMNFCLYELAKNCDIQDKLREEIEKALAANDGNLTYDVVMGIDYLDRVINETLRMYPPLESITRKPERDYKVPGVEDNLVIPKGTMVQIPIYALHHDPDYFPSPHCFEPDRFLPEEVKKRPSYVYMPFGEGPRNCIGLRFGMMQVKLGLITLLRDFRFTPSSDTPECFTFDPKVFVLTPSIGNYLQVERIGQPDGQ